MESNRVEKNKRLTTLFELIQDSSIYNGANVHSNDAYWVGWETDYVVLVHPTPPRTIHPPHQIAHNP